jgi:hypothetical protein
MTQYEYRVVAAPRRAMRVRGLKTSQERFAATVAEAINDAAADGWEFYRSETLPMDERQGMLKGRVEVLQSLLVFRRPLKGLGAAVEPEARAAPLLNPAIVPSPSTMPDPAPLRPLPAADSRPEPAPSLGPARTQDPGQEVPVIRLGAPRRDSKD